MYLFYLKKKRLESIVEFRINELESKLEVIDEHHQKMNRLLESAQSLASQANEQDVDADKLMVR